MTRFGLTLLFFSISVLFSVFSVLLDFGKEEEIVREESPKVEIVFPVRVLKELSKSFIRARAIRDILKAGGGYYGNGAVFVERFDSAYLEAVRISRDVEFLKVGGEKILRIKEFDLVVIGR